MTQSGHDLRSMPEARVREWFEGLPKEELVEMLVSHVLVYERERPEEAPEGGLGGMTELRELTFAQLMDRLKVLTTHPEMSRLRVDVVSLGPDRASPRCARDRPSPAPGDRWWGPALWRRRAPRAKARWG